MSNNKNIGQKKDKTKAEEIEAKLKNYAGPEGITTKQLEIGLWYVEHKRLLRKILYGFLILTAAISWVYTIYGFAYYFAKGVSEDEKLIKQLIEANSIGHDYIFQISAKQLAIAPVGILKSTGNQRYDLYVQLENDNPRWWAEFDYYFVAGGRQTPITGGFILPSESKYLLALAQEFAFEPSSAQLILENFRWHRLNQHQIADWNVYRQNHLNIESADIEFTPAASSPLSEKLELNQLNFIVINHTAYNYWQTGLAILLYSGHNIANVNYYTLSDFMSGQTRPVSISWPGEIGRVDKVEIVPEINIMKNNIYIKYEGGAGQEK